MKYISVKVLHVILYNTAVQIVIVHCRNFYHSEVWCLV